MALAKDELRRGRLIVIDPLIVERVLRELSTEVLSDDCPFGDQTGLEGA